MKNQYFGDRRDYLKYSLIRALGCELRLAVCWLLTDDNPCTKEGGKTDYLCKPDEWREYDPTVYDFLRGHVRLEERRVDVLEKSKLLGDTCRFFSCKVPNDGLGPVRLFRRVHRVCQRRGDGLLRSGYRYRAAVGQGQGPSNTCAGTSWHSALHGATLC